MEKKLEGDNTEDQKKSPLHISSCDLYVYAKYDTYPWSLHAISNHIDEFDIAEARCNSLIDPFKYSILFRCNSLIDQETRQQLINAITPLLTRTDNYRDPKFINALMTNPKPHLQELIYQFEHFHAYKQLKWNVSHVSDNAMPVALAPAIFSLTNFKFQTEINGLLKQDHVALYALIENIFEKFIPMFEWCLHLKLFNNNEYKQLSVIVKIHDYQFENENALTGRWHMEGHEQDDIVAVGLYNFDFTETDTLIFLQKHLDISVDNPDQHNHKSCNVLPININQNDCLVFRNTTVQHRVRISTKQCSSNIAKETFISNKVLTFFLLNPDNEVIANQKSRHYKWINFPWKISIFAKVWSKYDENICNNLADDIIKLIYVFAFGNKEYIENQKIKFRENRDRNVDESHIDSSGFLVIKTASD